MTFKNINKVRERFRIYIKNYRNKNRWRNSYEAAKQRCNNKKYHSYHRYGGRGIKFLLTIEDIKFIWSRDNACDLKWPSLDRIDNDGDYELRNCRFIEISENSRKKSK